MARPAESVERRSWEMFDISWGAEDGGIHGYLHRVVHRCMERLEADGATLFLQIEGSDTFLLAAQAGIDGEMRWPASFSREESIAGRVAATGEPVFVEQGQDGSDDRFPALRGGSAILAPLETPQGICIGVINVSRRPGATPFTAGDLRQLAQLGRRCALGVANARLVAKLGASVAKYRALAAQTSNIINSLQAGVILLDSAGRVVEANGPALRVLRVRQRRSIGLRWESLVERLPAAACGAIERCVASAFSGRPRRDSVAGSDGSHLTIFASPIPAGGVTLVIDDVTAQVEKERELARVRRLAEIGQMTAAIAHEIRNPLTSIRAAAQVIQGERRLATARAWGQTIEQEAIALNELCDQFLDFAKPLTLRIRPTDLSKVVGRLLDSYVPEMQQGPVSVHFKPDPRGPIIQADENRLAQALRNLIRNATEAMPAGGDLHVETGTSNAAAWIKIADTGPGIPEHELPKLFSAFHTTKPSGTGLGLCNVRRIADAHGGRVLVESAPGRGSMFTIELPIEGEEQRK